MHAAVCMLLLTGAAVPPQPPVEIWCALPEPLAIAAVPALQRLVPSATVRCVAPPLLAHELAPTTGERVLVGVPELLLLDLALAGALARVPGLGERLPPRGRDRQERFALAWRLDYAVAVAGDGIRADELRSWDDLAFAPQLEGRLGLCAPEHDPMPWLDAMAAQLGMGLGQDGGFALWARLDARTGGVYQPDYATMQAALAGGRLSAAVLPKALLHDAGTQGAIPAGAGGLQLVSLLGVAVSGNGAASPAATAAAASLLQLDDRALGFTPLAATAAAVPPLDAEAAYAWLRHFAEHVRGRGLAAENLAAGLDLVFGVLFAVFLLFVYLRIRREEQP